MAHQSSAQVASSQKALMLEMKSLQEEPVEGFKITLVDEADLYNWEVAIFGPPNTHYEGGYFKARIKFPIDYPYSPPTFRFLTKMWHPNIYEVRGLFRLSPCVLWHVAYLLFWTSSFPSQLSPVLMHQVKTNLFMTVSAAEQI